MIDPLARVTHSFGSPLSKYTVQLTASYFTSMSWSSIAAAFTDFSVSSSTFPSSSSSFCFGCEMLAAAATAAEGVVGKPPNCRAGDGAAATAGVATKVPEEKTGVLAEAGVAPKRPPNSKAVGCGAPAA